MTDNKLLVVEDGDVIREELCEEFEIEGYNVDLAKNGPEALEKVANITYVGIITDLVMPGGIDKLEFLEELKKKAKDAKLIVITGIMTDQDSFVKARGIGAYDYVVKGSDIVDHLRIALKDALAGKDVCEEFDIKTEEFLYEMYGKRLEEEHKGEFVAINFDGKIILDKDDMKVLKEAGKTFGQGKFIFKRVGYDYVYEA